MITNILIWGLAAGIIHFVFLGIVYGNPIVDKLYSRAQANEPSVKKWPAKGRYLLTQFLGTQIEVFLITTSYLWLRPLIQIEGLSGALILGLLIALLRAYPRFWNMWIQSTYPNKLLAIELVAGTIGTLVIFTSLEFLI